MLENISILCCDQITNVYVCVCVCVCVCTCVCVVCVCVVCVCVCMCVCVCVCVCIMVNWVIGLDKVNKTECTAVTCSTALSITCLVNQIWSVAPRPFQNPHCDSRSWGSMLTACPTLVTSAVSAVERFPQSVPQLPCSVCSTLLLSAFSTVPISPLWSWLVVHFHSRWLM